MEYYMVLESPVGQLLLTCRDAGLTGVWMDRAPSEAMVPGENHPLLQDAKNWLEDYFGGIHRPLAIPLCPEGTPFQQKVWQILLTIPYGEVCSYGSIAREMAALLGKEKMSAQAVGGAVGKNPISILIPCHRVVGSQGQLTGYAGGLDRKIRLLRHEGWTIAEDRIRK